ncbi:alpha-L-fucosidase [Mariniflexile sp. AS56]|uniref:alpha-L-fucosidase n=1 Tax=Mariniflexile sp. AS56 TaxID=3063957 RepID=UPI0026EB50C5|nr:alpha-L-fucosidase [Mariniflexile sp. AS56]
MEQIQKNKLLLSLLFILLVFMLTSCNYRIDSSNKDKQGTIYSQRLSKEKLEEWQNLKYGMFIHYGMSTFLGEELPDGKAPIDAYAPTDLDVSQWIQVAKDAGMNYAVLTAKHVAGHCLWPSKYTEYDVENNKDNTDVVGEFVKECRKQGIAPGIYYCAWDNHHDFFSLMPDKSENYSGALITPSEKDLHLSPPPFTTSLYQNFMTAQIDELLENYGPLVQFWIDIPIILGNGYREYIYKHITDKYPDMLVIMNHGKKQKDGELVFLEDKAWPSDALTLERYYSDNPYNPIWTIKGKKTYFPAESNLPIGNEWFWEDDDEVKPMDDLVKIFNGNLDNKVNFLLNVPPDRSGQIPEKWIKPLIELKKRMNHKINNK